MTGEKQNENIEQRKSFRKNLCCQDELNARNKSGIEKYRKGNFTIRFTQEGNKRISVRQIRHKFLFGSTGFMLGCFESEEKEKKFKELFSSLFNLAVVPFYWDALEPEEGRLRFHKDSEQIYRRPAPDTVLEFCRDYGIEPKGHCLTWNWMTPDWLKKYSPKSLKKRGKTILPKGKICVIKSVQTNESFEGIALFYVKINATAKRL